MTTVDLSNGAERAVTVRASALRARLRPDLARDMIPADAELVIAEYRYDDGRQTQVRLCGHTAACVYNDQVTA